MELNDAERSIIATIGAKYVTQDFQNPDELLFWNGRPKLMFGKSYCSDPDNGVKCIAMVNVPALGGTTLHPGDCVRINDNGTYEKEEDTFGQSGKQKRRNLFAKRTKEADVK